MTIWDDHPVTHDEALEQLRSLIADPPPTDAPATRLDAIRSLERVAELRLAVEGAAAALRQREDATIYAARRVMPHYGDASTIALAVRRSRQHVTTVVRDAHRAAAATELERERAAG